MSGGDRPFLVSTIHDPEFKSPPGREITGLVGSRGSYGKPHPRGSGQRITSIDRAVFPSGEQEYDSGHSGYYSESPGPDLHQAERHTGYTYYGIDSPSQRQQQIRQSYSNYSQRYAQPAGETSTTRNVHDPIVKV